NAGLFCDVDDDAVRVGARFRPVDAGAVLDQALLERLQRMAELPQRVHFCGAGAVSDGVGILERREGRGSTGTKLHGRAVERELQLAIRQRGARTLTKTNEREPFRRTARCGAHAIASSISSARCCVLIAAPRRRRPPSRCSRQPRSQLTMRSAPDAAIALSLRSSMLPEISAFSTENSPPNPQHSS